MKMFVVNGFPGSGKTLFAEYCDSILKEKFNHCSILRTSVVDPIKAIARVIGWNGDKDEKGRKLLSDLKDTLDSYNHFTFNSIDWNMEQRLFVCAYLQGFMGSSNGEWGLELSVQNQDFGTVPNCSPRRVHSLEQDFGT